MMIYTDQQQKLIDEMPFFIAINYEAAIDATDEQTRAELGLETFDLTLRLLTIVLVSQYLIRDQRIMVEPLLNDLLIKKWPVGDLDSWQKLFVTTIQSYSENRELFFVPELYDAYWDISNPQRRKERGSFIDPAMNLLAWRNDQKGNRQQPTDAAGWATHAQNVMRELDALLAELDFLKRYEFCRILEAVEDNKYIAERYVGTQITRFTFEYTRDNLQPNWYYLGKDRADFLLLNPMLIAWEMIPNETGIFYRLLDGQDLNYWLVQARDIEKNPNQLGKLLELLETITHIKHTMRPEGVLTWLQFTEAAAEITRNRMTTVSEKYNEDVYLQREYVLELFSTFMESESRCFVLTGKSGAGKSNFVLSLSGEFKGEQDICLLMVDASNVKGDLTDFITQDFRYKWGYTSDELPNIWTKIQEVIIHDRQKVLLVIDAINEHAEPQKLLKQVDELLQGSWKYLKVLITSRPETWRRISFGQNLAQGFYFSPPASDKSDTEAGLYLSACDIRPFSRDELSIVYKKYRKKYSIETDYDNVPFMVRQLIAEPLQLWMIATTYENQPIPDNLYEGELIKRFLDGLLTGDSPRLIVSDVTFLEQELVPLFAPNKDKFINELNLETLSRAENELLDRVFSEGAYSSGEKMNDAFVRLANAQIVVAHAQGLQSNVQFRYERFYDYFVGEHLYQQLINGWYPDLVTGFQALIDNIAKKPFLWGAVQTALVRALTDGKMEVIQALCITENPQVRPLIVSASVIFAKKNPDVIRQLASDLLDVKPPSRLVGRAQYPRDLLTAKEIAAELALELQDTALLSRCVRDKAEIVSDIGIKFVYTLDQFAPQKSIEVLEDLNQYVLRYKLPNGSVVRAFGMLSALLLMEHMREGLTDETDELMASILKTARKVGYVGQGRLQRVAGNAVRSLLISFGIKVILRALRFWASHRKESGDRATAVNLDELEEYYSRPYIERATAQALVPYLDRTHAQSFEEVEKVLLDAFSYGKSGWSTGLGNAIASAYGYFEPDKAMEMCHKIFDVDPGCGEVQLDAAIIWYQVVKRQANLEDAWLESGRELVKNCLENNFQGYGRFVTAISSYQQYPLLFYAALYNRKHPQRSNDLLEYFIEKAEKNNDMALLLHVIESFSDKRAYLTNYAPVLNSFTPYIHRKEPNPTDAEAHKDYQKLQNCLVNSLAAIRGMFPDQIDHFLISIDAPSQFAERVQQVSRAETSLALFVRMADFIYDLLIFGNEHVREALIELGTTLVAAPNERAMLENGVRQALNLFYGRKIFIS